MAMKTSTISSSTWRSGWTWPRGRSRPGSVTSMRSWPSEREGGHDLAIDLDPGGLEPRDQLAVGEPVRARRGVDAHDPQRAEVGLALLAVAVGVGEAALDGLARLAVRLAPSADVPLRLLHGLLVAAARLRAALRAWHGSTPFRRLSG